MAPSIRGRGSSNSRLINSLAIFLNVLSLSYLVLASSESLDDSTVSTPEECARECVANETKICYYEFKVETYASMGEACDLCTPNNTGVVNDCECVPADGIERSILTVNRRLPGPSIEVCLGDKVIIDVTNHMVGMELSIHWHGLYQKTTPYFDGVPFLTQCPIPQGRTFRYQWYAENSGSHFWHAHTGLQEMDGVFGCLIIREPKDDEPNGDLYDNDLSEHVMIINDWMHWQTVEYYPGLRKRLDAQIAEAVLINGMGQYTDPDTGSVTNTSLAEFTVSSDQSYRFRFISAFASVCYAQITIENHLMTCIAADGEPFSPVYVDSIYMWAGERYDCVITADQVSRSYWIQVRALGECADGKVQQLAILRYEGVSDDPISDTPTYDDSLATAVVLNPPDGNCNYTRDDAICVSHLNRTVWTDTEIFEGDADKQFYLPFQFFFWDAEVAYEPGYYRTYLHNHVPLLSLIDNITYQEPPAPPLSQYDDIPETQFCNQNNIPDDCGTPCACTHVLNVDIGDIVELIIYDAVAIEDLMHPFHLHGHAFYVLGMGHVSENRTEIISAENVRDLDNDGQLDRNGNYPVAKDTIPVPTAGYVILRFRANNPGWWLMHCHFVFHMGIGMDFVVHVGEQSDLPDKPDDFPTCGNYLPAITYGDAWVNSTSWH